MYSAKTNELRKNYLKKILFQSYPFFFRVYDYQENILIFSSHTFDNAIRMEDILKKVKEHLPQYSTLIDYLIGVTKNTIIAPFLVPNLQSGDLMFTRTGSYSEEVLSLRGFIEQSISKDVIGIAKILGTLPISQDIEEKIKKMQKGDFTDDTTKQDNTTNTIKRIKQSLLQNAQTLLQHPETIYTMRGFKLWTGSEFAVSSISFNLDTVGMIVFSTKEDNSKYTLVGEQTPRLRTINWEDIDRNSLDYLFPFLSSKLEQKWDGDFNSFLVFLKALYRLIGQYVITFSLIIPSLIIQRLMQQGQKFSFYAFFKFQELLNDKYAKNTIPVLYIHSFGEDFVISSNTNSLQPYGIPKNFTVQANSLQEITYGVIRLLDEINMSFYGLSGTTINGKSITEILAEQGGKSTLPQLQKNPITGSLYSLYPTKLKFAFDRGKVETLLQRENIGTINLYMPTDPLNCFDLIQQEIDTQSQNVNETIRKEINHFVMAFDFNRVIDNIIGSTVSLSTYQKERKVLSARCFDWVSKTKTYLPLMVVNYPQDTQSYLDDEELVAKMLWNYTLIQMLMVIQTVSILLQGGGINNIYVLKERLKEIRQTKLAEIIRVVEDKFNTVANAKTLRWSKNPSFYRDYKRQIEIINKYKSNSRVYTAIPFGSPHNYALAVDLATWKWGEKAGDINAQKNGAIVVNNLLKEIMNDNNLQTQFEAILQHLIDISAVNSSIYSKLIYIWFTPSSHFIDGIGTDYAYWWLSPIGSSKIYEPWHFSLKGAIVKKIPTYKYFKNKALTCWRKLNEES